MARIKDYYKILELTPQATPADIKRNFRRLALQFHPDTNQGHAEADAWYREIQEAYQTLSDPVKKSNYLQERWLLKSKGLSFAETAPLTPALVVRQCRQMVQQVAHMDHFRMDHAALEKQLLALLPEESLEALERMYEPEKNQEIIQLMLTCMEPLHWANLTALQPVLLHIAHKQPGLQQHIHQWYARRKRQHWWDTHQGWMIGLATVLLCGLIAWLSTRSTHTG